MSNLYRAVVFAVVHAATSGGHEIGDYLEQPDWAARAKQQPGPEGRGALHRHVAGYTTVQTVATLAALKATGVRVPLRAVLAGQAVNAVTHWAIDRGPVLRRFADLTGKRGFHDLATGGVNGRALLDQAAHKGILPIAAAVTAAMAGRSRQ